MFNIIKRFYSFTNNNVYNFITNVNKFSNIKLLNNVEIVNNIINKNLENISHTKNFSNYSGKFGEKLVEELLIIQNIKYCKQFKYNNLRPDFITDNYIIEVKTTLRNNKTYDNIIFSGFKYHNLAKKLNKSLIICLVGYDDSYFNEYINDNELFRKHIENQKLNNIEYVFFHNELLKYLKNDKSC